MKSILLAAAGTLAAAVFCATPGAARNFSGSARVVGQSGLACDNLARGESFAFGDRRGHRRMRATCSADTIMDVYGGEWALYNNRSWEPDSYNDWWHDRPDRAYPAWMRHNQDCQRMWFAGDTLRC